MKLVILELITINNYYFVKFLHTVQELQVSRNEAYEMTPATFQVYPNSAYASVHRPSAI